MSFVQRHHCIRAIKDISDYGDNDVLPFDIDSRFFRDKIDDLQNLLFSFASRMEKKQPKDAAKELNRFTIFSERLLAPAGYSGFRITTKIHPFWNAYLNAIAIALAAVHEPNRSSRTYSYRYQRDGDTLFDRASSWRAFREATMAESDASNTKSVVVQTDISSFYEHVYHHRLENFVSDLLPSNSNIPTQIDRILSQLAVGRSFGLPVGGQGARILAEILLASIDRSLDAKSICWFRFVDDFVLIAADKRDAYEVLGILANALSDLGLSLNRSKTSILTTKHYSEYVNLQLHGSHGDDQVLREIDLHFDPYSDSPTETYTELKEAIEQIDISRIIRQEESKAQADPFIVSQIGRTLRFMEPDQALEVSLTLLSERNLHTFRASWATIMRGIAGVRGDETFCEIHNRLDEHIDKVVEHSQHLLSIDSNALHFLRLLRFATNQNRIRFLVRLYELTDKVTIRRACMECWRRWKDRERFLAVRGTWQSLHPEQQRMFWLASMDFGDDGAKFRQQVEGTLRQQWALGFETRKKPSFWGIFDDWVQSGD